MISLLTHAQASEHFARLPAERQIATLSPDYLLADSARDAALEPLFAAYNEGDAFWLHGALRARVPQSDLVDLQSPYGYGGPVSNSDDAPFLQRAWQAYSGWCRESRILAEFVRLHPLANAWQPYFGTIVADRQTISVPLEGDIRTGYKTRARTAIKKAERAGITVSEKPLSEVASRFAAFYSEGMTQIGAQDFYLFGADYFQAFAKLPEAHLLACELNGEWVSAGLFLQGGASLEYHLSATSDEGRKHSATNLLLDYAAHFGQQKSLQSLYLGGGTGAAADNPLFFFKSGFSRMTLPFRYAYAIPLPDAYYALQENFRQASTLNSRILFYRQG